MPFEDDGLDHSVIEDLKAICRETGDDVSGELLQIFLAALPDRITEIRRFVSLGDSVGLLRAAHRLKGSSATLGASRMALICAELEATVKAKCPVSEAEAKILALEVEAERVCSVLPAALRV